MWLTFLLLPMLCVVAMTNTTDYGAYSTRITTEETTDSGLSTTKIATEETDEVTTRLFTSEITTKNSTTAKPAIGLNTFPYVVSIGAMVKGYYKHLCVGVIISNKNLLSAAHCVKPPHQVHQGKLYVIGGSDRLNGKVNTHFVVIRIEAHPRFKVLKGYDIAVLEVSTTFPLNDGRFKSISFNLEPPPDGFVGSMVGWGRVKVGQVKMLKQTPFQTIGNAKCIKSHRFVFLRNTDFCAVHLEGSQGACDGDSGAPLMDVERERLYGLLSYGRKACRPFVPYAFSHVGMFSDWIEKTMSRNVGRGKPEVKRFLTFFLI